MSINKDITKGRDERSDAVKYWLVVLVIAAHVLMRKEFVDSKACTVLWNWIVTFTMPLFIFISGKYSQKKGKGDFWPSIWKIVEPLLLFHIIALLFYVDSITVKTILTPWFMLWYLFSLICWRLLLQIIPDNILEYKKLILISTFCISILAGFLPFGKVLSLQRTLAFMPFFFLGYYMKDTKLYLPNKYKMLCIVFLFGVLAIMSFFPHRITYLHNYAPYKNIMGAVIRMINFAIAIPMSIAFVNVCHSTPWIARQGRMSMQYYIYHALLLPPLMVLAAELNVPMTFVSAIIIIIVITVGLGLVLHIPYINLLTNPSLIFAKKRKTPKK